MQIDSKNTMNNKSKKPLKDVRLKDASSKQWIVGIIIVAVVLILFSVIFNSCTNEDSQSTSSTSSQLSSVQYEIIREEDISYATAKRLSIDVAITNNPATKAHVVAVSEKIINDYKNKADAIAIFFYYDKGQVEGAYTLAKAEWAPNGKWEDADQKTNQMLTYEYADAIDTKRTVSVPTEKEREISNAMTELWLNSEATVSDEELARQIAPQFNMTIEEVLAIDKKVNDYDLGIIN